MFDDHGDVTGEYLALRSGAAFVSGTHGLIWVYGGDAVEFADGQLSQDVAAMEPRTVARSFLLEPRGKLVGLLWVLKGSEGVGLFCDAPVLEAVAAQLRQFLFRVDAVIEVEERPMVSVIGPDASSALAAAGVEAPEGWGSAVEPVQYAVARADLGALPRFLLSGHVSFGQEGIRPAGRIAYDAVRIEAGEPVAGIDVDATTIPQETGLVPASVSFTKGCYLGQELVARIDSRGHVNRHLLGIVIGTNVLPPLGSQIVEGERQVGTLTSLGESLELRAPVGLALVRKEVAPGSEVSITWDGGSAPAVVRALPLDDFSTSLHSSNQ